MKLMRLVLGPSEPGQIVWKQLRNVKPLPSIRQDVYTADDR